MSSPTAGIGPAHPTAATTCRVVVAAAEVAEHHRIRHEVFVREQGIFAGSDLDAHDARSDALHVVAWTGDVAAGTVRLFPLDPLSGSWQGDRLAVLPAHRALGLAAPLVRFAVAAAGERGGLRMIAHVQLANQRFFEQLGWCCGEPETYAGRPHIIMSSAL